MRLSKPVTQGGQTFLHRMRMLGQIVRLASFFSAMLTLLVFGTSCYLTFSEKHIDQYITAWHSRFIQYFWGPHEIFKHYRVSCWVKRTEPFLKWVHQKLLLHLTMSFFAGLVLFIIVFIIWARQGSKAHQKKIIAGSSIQPKKVVMKMIYRDRKASDLNLMGLPLIKGTETQHMLITGTTGSGKTNAFNHMMNQIEGQKTVVVDFNGEFANRYYDPSCDIIMNPFDKRFPGWDLFGECRESYHFDDLAESLIPQEGHDLFWTQSARTVLSSILDVLSKTHQTSISNILEMAVTIPLKELHKKLSKTKAAALLDPQSEKTATSIRMNVAAHIACLENLTGEYKNPLSIRRWIQDDSEGGRLFLTATPAQRAALRPLISCWMSIAIKSLMECTPNHHRRLWFMIDELPSLHKLTDLSLCLAEGRKYGACMVLGFQNIPQLEELYGQRITQSLVDLCSTKVLFKCASFDMAEKISRLIGTQEREELQEGISFGAHEMRDGVSLNMQTKEKLVIPPYNLTTIKDLVSYVQLPQGYPITKIEWKMAETLKPEDDNRQKATQGTTAPISKTNTQSDNKNAQIDTKS